MSVKRCNRLWAGRHILNILNLTGAIEVWHIDLEKANTGHYSEIRHVGGPPSSRRTGWQHWLRYGSRISWNIRTGPKTKVPGMKSFLPTSPQIELSLSCLNPAPHMPWFHDRNCAFSVLSSAPALSDLTVNCWGFLWFTSVVLFTSKP